VVLIGVI